MKNIEKKWTLFLIATFVTFFGIVNVLLKGTKANEVPVNANFDDINFYKKVVDTYNMENETNHDYTYNLSDEELSSIDEIYIEGELDTGITSIKGIEKLTGITGLWLAEFNFSEIDLSNNDNLQYISIFDRNGSSINANLDLSDKENLILLNLENVSAQSLDLTNCNKLEQLSLSDEESRLSNVNLDLGNKLNLTQLDIFYVTLSELDLSNNDKLESLTIYDKGFKIQNINLDLLDKTNLEILDILDILITKLDLSANDKLHTIAIKDEEHKIIDINLDLSDKGELGRLNLEECLITELDLSNNIKLINLFILGSGFDKELELSVGDTYDINIPIVLPNGSNFGEFTYLSSNDDIVSVSQDGVLKANDQGEVLLTIELDYMITIEYAISVTGNSTGDEDDDETIIDYGKIDDEKKIIHSVKEGVIVGEKPDGIEILDKDNVLIVDETHVLRTGDKIKMTLDEVIYTVSVLGDVNGDGLVTKEDALKIAKHIISNEEIAGYEYIYAADINEDGKISLSDFVKIAKYIINGSEL